MCGIAGGIWAHDAPGLTSGELGRMTDAIAHRGPDDQGHLIIPPKTNLSILGGKPSHGVALGFRRLSIIDLSTGHQPLGNEDGTVQIVFNGEIYNYRKSDIDSKETVTRFERKQTPRRLFICMKTLALSALNI